MFKEDFTQANLAIRYFVDIINENTNNGKKIIITENIDNPILQMFDQYSGIDAIQITNDNQIRTLALRIQYGKAWDTFTIRYKRTSGAKTEYEKRLDAINNEKLYPNITIQCYLSDTKKELLSYGMIFTKKLYEQIQKNPQIVKIKSALEDGNQFIFVSFYDLTGILIYKNGKVTFRY